MAGKMICLLVMAFSLLVLLWLVLEEKEKYKKDAAKVLALTGLLGFAICISESANQRLAKDGRLQRNEAGEESDSQELQLYVDGQLEDPNYSIAVEARKLQGEELEQLFTAAHEEAESLFLGENESMDCIDQPVTLPNKLQNGQIRTKWAFEPEGIIDEEGELWTKEVGSKGVLVMASLTLRYDEEARNYSFGCHVYKKRPGSMERLWEDLEDYLEKEQEKSKNKPYLQLPLQLNGRSLRWTQKPENTYRIILMLGFVAAVVVYLQQNLKEQRQEQKRRDQLLRQYPDMVSKISLLLGAGMTLSGAWERIVLNYMRQLERNQTEKTEVYENMLLAYREMQDGVGELRVYQNFGERCGTPQYRKLTMLIIQNLRKGSAGLTNTLEKEVTEAFALRKNQAKKAGEEAATKILMPMMLMLCIVMVIILVPAFLTFQM